MENKLLSKQPYKGTKDWYPADIYVRNYLFETWSRVAQKYGYQEYDTSQIEQAELYRKKSGEELGSQLYNFKDKGGREIALRPEMTPSLARMIALKRNQLSLPIRWFNIGRYYRYEKPQKGRTREFFQLNIDILGVSTINAEVEIIQYVIDVMRELKAPENTYELRVNNRYLLNYLFDEILDLNSELKPKLARALDNYLKMEPDDFNNYLLELGLSKEQIVKIEEFLNWDITDLEKIKDNSKGAEQLIELFKKINTLMIPNIKFTPYIVRGLAYYTGTVIELYDIGQKETPRALFGGGRYDNLLEIFNEEPIPAFGLGWGEVTTLDYLEKYNLIPQYRNSTEVFVCLMDDASYLESSKIASYLRENGFNCLMQLTAGKLSNQLKYASNNEIPWVVIVGEDEIKKGVVQLKNMQSRESFLITKEEVIQKISAK